MKRGSVIKLVSAAIFAALIFIGTQFISIPLAFGYFNLGDAFVLLAGYLFGGPYAAAAAIIGSVSADLLSGYAVYAPATLLIKPLMALVIAFICRRARGRLWVFSLGAVLSELIMVIGYFICDTLLYGASGALASLPANLLQAGAAVVIGGALMLVLEKTQIVRYFRL